MVQRQHWIRLVRSAWKERSIVWLTGVRRVGKTYLAQSFSRAEYFDCELPRTRRLLDDPEAFLDSIRGKRLILDEIHRLRNPSQLLKIAADHYPGTKILATGSSTLGASAKFRDTLAGRKREVWLTPMNQADAVDFGNADWHHRMTRGGLPPFFLPRRIPERDYQEWIDAYWARDIQELFRLERRHAFQTFLELLLVRSGGIFEATAFSEPCEISRTTVLNYLKVLEATFVVHVLRPFTSRRRSEIVAAPKVYAFDTGFVCHYRGWRDLRADDMGLLWEHLVLNELHASLQTRAVKYWRDKRGHEVDFVIQPRGRPPLAIECKWSADHFSPENLRAFQRVYPDARFLVVAQDIDRSYDRDFGMPVSFVSLSSLIDICRKRLGGH